MSRSMTGRGIPKRTSPTPWRTGAFTWQQVARSVVNKLPKLREELPPMPFLDGATAIKKPHQVVLHDVKQRNDNYHYMEDLFDRDTLKFVKQEQQHMNRVDLMLDLKHQKGRLWLELDSNAVVSSREGGFDKGEERIGNWIYFTRQVGDEGTDLGFFRKQPGQVDLLAEELINPQKLKQHFGYASCTVGVCRISQDGKYLAYTVAVEGGDRYICHVRSVDDQSLFHVIRGNNITSVEFGSSNQLFYTECNDLNRPYRIMRQELRPGLLSDPIEVYRDEDETLFVDVRKTKDNAFLIFSSESRNHGSLHLIPSSYPNIPYELRPFFRLNKPIKIATNNSWGWLEHINGHFLMVMSSKQTPNTRVVYAREEVVMMEGIDTEKWKELVPHRDDTQVIDLDLFANHVVLFEMTARMERSAQIRVIDVSKGLDKSLDRSKDTLLHFPPMSQILPGLNKNWDQDSFSFTYSSLIQPARECVHSFSRTFDMKRSLALAPTALYTQRQHEIFSPADYMWPYNIYRDFVTGHDGEAIPVTIAHRRDVFVQEATDFDLKAGSPRNALIYVYGAYGEIPNMHFQLAPFLWLLRRRWTICIAHVRGGGEKVGWAEAGKGQRKINTIRDFISCCEHLVQTGYTTPDKLVACGHSAGCVPIAAAANMRGNSLFDLALLRAPFLDVINTMADPNLPLSLAECDDWGDILNNKDDLRALEQYDPYLNINDRVNYPSMMISACLDDDRVPAWNTLKYIAKLREQRQRKNVDPIATPLLARIESTGGHFHWNGMTQVSEELAFLSHRYDIPGPGSKVDDMDLMDQMNNMFDAGVVDHDEAKTTFLKWDDWEKERVAFIKATEKGMHEPNYRSISKERKPFNWDFSEERKAYEERGKEKPFWSEWAKGAPSQNDQKTQ